MQWVVFVLVFKVSLFSYFALQHYRHWDQDKLVNGLAVVTGDTFGYYISATNFAEGKGYDNFCRMPGILPLYAPVAALLGEDIGKVWMVFCQLILSIISIFILAQWANDVFKLKLIYPITLVLYTISSFTSVLDHLLMADSLSISFFIFSLYFLKKGLDSGVSRFIFFAGVFLAWSVFLRQIMLVVYPVVALLIVFKFDKNWKQLIASGFIFIIPLVLALGAWSQYTFTQSGRRLILAAPVQECYSTYTLQYQEASGLLIDMGFGEPFWTEGSVPKWFFRDEKNAPVPIISDRHFHAAFTLDSLISLRNEYRDFAIQTDTEKQKTSAQLLEKIRSCRLDYRANHVFDYYVLNKLRHVRVFLFPLRLENFPGPAFNEMNFLGKALKFFYLLFFSVVAPLGIFALLLVWRRSDNEVRVWTLFPFTIFIALAPVLGFVEQRYFAPIYPLCVVGCALLMSRLLSKFSVDSSK